MKKIIVTILVIGMVFSLMAQQDNLKKKTNKKKVDWEAEYYKMEKQKDNVHNAYQTLMKEHEKLRKEKKALETKNQNLEKIKEQVKILKEENAKLKAQLDEHKKKTGDKKHKKTSSS